MASIFGIDDSKFQVKGKTILDVLEEWGNNIQNDLRKSLRDNGSGLITSGMLEQSILAMPVKTVSGGLELEIQGLPYYKYVNKGVQGVGGKKSDGTPWQKKSTGSPFAFKEGRKPSVKHFVDWAYLAGKSPFVIRELVYRRGIKANHFVDEVINPKLIQQVADDLGNVIGKTIEFDITEAFNKK